MEDAILKEVRFDKWCGSCKHRMNHFPGMGVSSEFQRPCCKCLESVNAMREGTDKPVYWEKP